MTGDGETRLRTSSTTGKKGIASSVKTELAPPILNQYGAFSIDGTAPGAYHLYAFEKVQDDSWEDLDLLREIDGKGVALRLEEGAAESVEVPMIRHSELGALLARLRIE